MSFLDELEQDLVDAARRRRDARRAATVARMRQRLGLRRVALATLLAALAGTASAAATLTLLTGSVIPGPAAQDVPRDQLPQPGSARVSELRAADPEAGALPWTLRLARSSTGLLCTTVGQVDDDGRFGLTGLDGRFRTYAEGVAGACGEAPESGRDAPLAGARVFDADRVEDVRTVVAGVGGPALRAAELDVRGERRPLQLGAGGSFVAALAGFPEDSGLDLILRYADGREERHAFGREPGVVADPVAGPAWRVEGVGRGGDPFGCVSFEPARPRTPAPAAPGGVDPYASAHVPSSPTACGTAANERPDGYQFAVRRLEPGSGRWGSHQARTAVWGAVGGGVERVEVEAPGGVVVRPRIQLGGDFLALFGPEVDPASLTVRVVLGDGRAVERSGDVNLIEQPGRGR